MSSAEITLGAHLYTRAIEEDVPALLNDNPQDYSGLKLAFRDMSRWLVSNKCVNKDKDGNWAANNAGIDSLSDDDAKAFLPYYQTVVMAHQNADAALTRDGKSGYMKEFRELHADTIFEIEPETVTRVRANDMQAITTSALNLLDATHKDPANAAFVPGLEKAPMDTMWNILHDSGYLMPGENPNRTADLGEQPLRGTPEQQDALYHQATQMAANMDMPTTLNQGDRPMAAALNFKNAVENAHAEEVEAGIGTIEDGWDSDLTKADCNSAYNVLTAFGRVMHDMQWDTQSLDTVLADPRRVDDLRIALEDYNDKGVGNALMSGNMGDPQIDPDAAVRLGKGIAWMNEAVNADLKSEHFSGDDGGMMTQGGKSKAASRDFDDEISSADGFENAFDEEDKAAKDTGKGTAANPIIFDADADLSAESYGRSEKRVRLPRGLMDAADEVFMEVVDNHTADYLRRRAGRAEADMGDIASSKAAFGTVEEMMGQYQESSNSVRGSNDVITAAQKANMNPERRERLRTAKVVPGRDVFKNYRAGAPGSSRNRMKNFLDDNMLTEEGKPNYDMRRFLRDATQMQVEAPTRGEGEAIRAYAEKFVARDREEVEQRKKASLDNKGISQVEFDSKDIARFISVKEASGTEGQVKAIIGTDGSVTLSDPDAPKLTSKLSKISEELAKTLEGSKDKDRPKSQNREFGGMVSVESLKAAYQTGADRVSVMFSGEMPYGVIGKMEDEPVRKKTKSQDIVLS
jgi:hypothetical protein